MNTLYSAAVGPSAVPKLPSGALNLAQESVHQHLGRCASQLLEEPSEQQPREALYELLRTKDFYSEEESPRVPYDPEQLKIFRTGTVPRELSDR